MKLCKDCKFLRGIGCQKEINKVDYICGNIYCKSAQSVRENVILCGPEGKWWEAKDEKI